MRYLLNAFYLLLLSLYLPVVTWQRIWKGKKRPGLWSKFRGLGPVNSEGRPTVVFHAVSLGEVQAIRKLVEEFGRQFPDWKICISTTTQTGLEAVQRQFPKLLSCLLPMDFSWANRRFLNRLRPDLLVLAELEIWPNLLSECRRRSIPVCLVNARLNSRTYGRYQKLVKWLPNPFRELKAVCCQNTDYGKRFISLGVPTDRIEVTGNLKYDTLSNDRNDPKIKQLASLASIQNEDLVLIAGSTQAPEEQLILEVYRELSGNYPNLRLLICPRHPERFEEVAALLDSHGFDFTRRSKLVDLADDRKQLVERVILLDCMGELMHWWGTGHIAFVGGSFGNRGGQNMMEPLALGNAVCFGPDTRNFSHEVNGLLHYQAAVQLQDRHELKVFIENCFTREGFREKLVAQGQKYLAENSHRETPAWKSTLARIQQLFPKSTENRRQTAA